MKKGHEFDELGKVTPESCYTHWALLSDHGMWTSLLGLGVFSRNDWAVFGRGTIRYRPFNLLVIQI